MKERIQSWMEHPFDVQTREEIRRLAAVNPQALVDAFYTNLSFGTGGIRGLMGLGPNRLNIYTIRMITQGLAQALLKKKQGDHTVFIGYDVRHNSRLFAEETAKVFAGNGVRVLLSRKICPTPLVSFACRYYSCSFGIMITASHNPPEYNGYKVYQSDGCQITPQLERELQKEIETIQSPHQVVIGLDFEWVGDEIDAAYLDQMKKLQILPELSQIPLQIVYTNLHGTGIRLIPQALHSWGYKNLSFVEEQKSLDGNFPNALSPNPEEETALSLGWKQLIKQRADILIATDPDADRIGLVEKNHRFTGNQIACLCLDHICTNQPIPKNGAFVKTLVTTELFRKIAESFGKTCVDVLTGFKYIGEQIGNWETLPDGPQYIFGAEESYGYLFGTHVRDKDAISTACLIAEMAALAKLQKITLLDRLHQIYQKYGVHREQVTHLTFPSSEKGMMQRNETMQQLRTSPPQQIGPIAVVSIDDYSKGREKLPPSDVLCFQLKEGSKIVIRPSGTEPKIKIYLEVSQKMDSLEAIKICDLRLADLQKNVLNYLS